MDPANRIERSAMILSRVKQNDPALIELVVSNTTTGRFPEGTGNYCHCDSADLARLGDAIGNNTNLRSLDIRSTHELVDIAATNGAFFEGLNKNTSINTLRLMNCDLSGGMAREILNGFVANNSNLTYIGLLGCTLALGNGGAGVLASAVSGCTNLTSIMFPQCNIDDDILAEFVSGIRGLHRLRRLDLRNNIGRAGCCEAIATLLQEPNCNLPWLVLSGNSGIDDNCAAILANSLKGNRRLYRLDLSDSAITESGWDAFSQSLCNTSSVNETYLSNHTLNNLGNANLPNNLSALLELNRGTDKKQVSIRKILRHHTQLDMEPFLEWDLKVLPLAVSWFRRARDYARHEEFNVDVKKLSAIYQFARALPMKFVPSPSKATSKRKIGEVN